MNEWQITVMYCSVINVKGVIALGKNMTTPIIQISINNLAMKPNNIYRGVLISDLIRMKVREGFRVRPPCRVSLENPGGGVRW